MKKKLFFVSLSVILIMTSSFAIYNKFFAVATAYFKDCGGNCTSITSGRFSFEALQTGNQQAYIANKNNNILFIYLNNTCTQGAQFIECGTN